MRPREWLLSLLFVAVIAVKAAEAIFGLETWPLSNVPMFAGYVPRMVTPLRVTLVGTRDGTSWFALSAYDLLLSQDEYERRLPTDARALAAGCGELGRLYNAGRPPSARLVGLYGRIDRVPRPGVPGGPSEPESTVVTCLLSPPSGR
jgi:hypothetical protein